MRPVGDLAAGKGRFDADSLGVGPILRSVPPPSPARDRVGQPGALDVVLKGVILLLLVCAVLVTAHTGALGLLLSAPITKDAGAISVAIDVAGLLVTAYFVMKLVLSLRYRPTPGLTDAELPLCTVVVPAYNEGAMVRVALTSALESNYPAERLRVVAVDDGSTDDTWRHIEAVARQYPGRVVPIRMPKNGGKREALRTGFLRAEGEVVVTVDSDSQLDRDAIRSAVAPIVRNPKVGAVAGKVMVLNRYESVLTRLLAARFFVTFDLSRAAQSQFGAVLCCPGALTAYRRASVMEVLERWSEQTFMGAPCTIAEDRALTTWILRSGYRAVYQSTAIVRTLVPTKLRAMSRMLIRWERGNIREDLVMLPVLFTGWRKGDRLGPTVEVLNGLLQYPLGFIGLAMIARHLVLHPMALVPILATVCIVGFVQSLYSLRTERSTDLLFGVGYVLFAFVGLQWIFPYSFLTLRNGRWLTR